MALLAASSSLSSLSLRCAHSTAPLPSGSHSSRVSAPLIPSLTPHLDLSLTRHHVEMGGSALAGALFAALASSDSAIAAQEVMNIAAGDDNRGFGLLLTLVPAVAWVLFNILQPALNQIDRMKSAKGMALGLGLGAAASLLATPQADASQEIANLAVDSDSRGLLLLIVLVPAVGWVLFNILQPALNQVNKMRSSKGLVGAVGLGAAASSLLFATFTADAAVQEMASLAESTSDARGALLLGVLVPAVGWVLFNILQPALNQLDKMKASKGVIGAIGLGAAAALYTPHADASQELASLADNDSRGTLLLAVLIPAVVWVLFNILQPALNQVSKMRAQK